MVGAMRGSYDDIQTFLDDIHEYMSVKQLALDLGLVQKSDFRGQKVCCLFHREKTPSMQLASKFFKCYGCGVGGDAVKLVQLAFNTGFLEAVQKIAQTYSIDISGMRIHFDHKLDELRAEWERFLLDMESAPEAAKMMKSVFFPQEIGYDKKIRYVVMPFTSRSGSILGFTKRRVDELHDRDQDTGKFDSPKWVHSNMADTLISQCNNVFNLHDAASAVRMTGEVVVCEGPKDTIAWRRAGVPNVVGSCGTSNSVNIWDSILPAQKIFLSMDGDGAGKHSVGVNVIYLSEKVRLDGVFVIKMPDGMDPYDVVTQCGAEALRELKERAVPAVQWMVESSEPQQVLGLYLSCPEWYRMTVLKEICKIKCFSLSETESWLRSLHKESSMKKQEESDEQMDEKSELLKLVNGQKSSLNMDVNKAIRVLKMRYGVDVE